MEQFLTRSATISNDEIILVLTNNTFPCYEIFISSLRRQPNLTLKFLMTNLIQEETLMKNLYIQLQITHEFFVEEKMV
jgi:hypothetical protein